MRHAALILCGGRSSRMGRAKAWLPWFGRTMIEHVTAAVAPAVDEVVVVTSERIDLPPLDARIVRDTEPERGPLAAIRDGLAATRAELAFVTSTDAPFVDASHVERLLDFGRPVAPRAEGHVQVLSAVYRGDGGKGAAELLDRSEARPLALLEATSFRALDVEEAEGEAAPAPWTGFNRPGEYLDWARRVAPDATAEVELLGRAARGASAKRVSVPIGTLGEVLAALPVAGDCALVEDGRVAAPHLVCLGGRELVRALDVPVGPGERVSVVDALAGG